MRNIQLPKGKWHKAGAFALLLACSSLLLLLPGCRNVMDPPQDATGTGTLSLAIDSQGVGRTILPDISIDDFVSFDLLFTPQSGGGGFLVTWGGGAGAGTGTIPLDARTWDLHVTAFLSGGAAAEGSLEGIVVPLGGTVYGSVALVPIPGGTGTFSWDISFDADIRFARMAIERDDDWGQYYWGTFYLLDNWWWSNTPVNPGSSTMDAGQYRVTFTLGNYQGAIVTIHETLHVYNNMTSHFQEAFDFPVTMLRFILDSWNGVSWNFVERGIAAGHLAMAGIDGIYEGNFSDIVNWFNILSASVGWAPTSQSGLRVLTDAALIGIASVDADFLDADNYQHRGDAELAIIELLRNATGITFNWIDERTVSVNVGGAYTLQIVFSAYLSLPPPPEPGDSLADWLAWLRIFAESGGRYYIVISGDEDISVLQAALPTGRSNLTLNLSATVPSTVSLANNGSLFTVDSGLTLVLDNNVTLQGRDGNNAVLLQVNSGGNLVMNAGSRVMGNTNNVDTISLNAGGGVRINSGGTFTMNGGAISGHTTSTGGQNTWGGGVLIVGGTFTMNDGAIYNNSANVGGGVFLDGGTLNMNGGEISNNTSHWGAGGVFARTVFNMRGGTISGNIAGTGDGRGGGLRVGSGGTFRISNGLIYGNDELEGNTAWDSGAALFLDGGTAQFGTFSGNDFTRLGYLRTLDLTIEVVDGVLIRPYDFVVFSLSFDANGATWGQPPGTLLFQNEDWVSLPGRGNLWRSGYNFGGWNTAPDGSGGQYLPGDLLFVGQAITLYAQWLAVDTLADRFTWLRAYAQVGGTYTIDISAYGDRYLTPAQAAFPTGRGNLTITLEASEPSTISLAASGSLFAIGSGITLVLGDNVTLEGINNNNSNLVSVDWGGTLIMEGARIVDNMNMQATCCCNRGGGVRVFSGGTFIMNSGEISGNVSASWWWDGQGGGVFVSSGGTFDMHGGVIFGNNGDWQGGGVFNEGTFRMSGGIIYGNESAVEAEFMNTAPSGAALFNSGTAQIGTFNNGTFSASVTLSTTNYTISVANGVRVGGNLTISLAAFQSVETDIEGPSLSLLGTQYESSASATVLDPEQFDSITWFSGANDLTWSGTVSGSHGETITFDANLHGNRLGTHIVTVEVRIGGALYSKRIAFTVVP